MVRGRRCSVRPDQPSRPFCRTPVTGTRPSNDLLLGPAADDALRPLPADPSYLPQAVGSCSMMSNTASPKACTSFLA